MSYKKLAHLALITDRFDEMVHFYCDKLGMRKVFSLTFDTVYQFQLEALKKPGTTEEERSAIQGYMQKLENIRDKVWLTYFEVAPEQFIEIFNVEPPLEDGVHRVGKQTSGYGHMSIQVDDIKSTAKELQAKGVKLRTDISFGPDYTYQFWIDDPDGNQIEFMQYTDKSFQLQ